MSRILVISRGFFYLSPNTNLYFNDNDGHYLESLGRNHTVFAAGLLVNHSNIKKYGFVQNYTFNNFSSFTPLPFITTSAFGILKSLFQLLSIGYNADFIYVMGPGIVKYAIGLFFLLSGKPIGLYNGIGLRPNKFPRLAFLVEQTVVSRSRFVIATGESLCRKYKNMGARRVESARPITKIDLKRSSQYNPIFALSKKLQILCIGVISERKNQIELIRALQLLRSPDRVECHIVGGGNDDFIKSHKTDLESVKCPVRFYGHVSCPQELSTLYSACDVLVLTSKSEGFPRVFHEACSWGLRIICSDIPCGHELRSKDPLTVLYQLGNTQSLADAIEWLEKPAEKCPRRLNSATDETSSAQFCRLLEKTLVRQ